MVEKKITEAIVEKLKTKSAAKFKAYDNTLIALNWIKDIIKEITDNCNCDLEGEDKRILLTNLNQGKYETELQIADELLIFNMHSNIFEFDRDHQIWKLSYLKEDNLRSYCGVINIYNFLADSFKHNRLEDLGYLVARIFINNDMHFFVEGKRQLGFLYNNFGTDTLTKDKMEQVIASALNYTLEFDLLVPQYDTVKIANVAQINEKIETSKIATGKRLGYKFLADDISDGK
ncbi:MAG: hypothetical protein N4A72_09915 [Bacteroidales bacterium]|jgi:hypothetical protein|nr:hypothetical protein [Bacteroidales bacterium]